MIKQIAMDYWISAYIVTCTSRTTINVIVLERILKISEVVSNPFVFVYTIKYVQFESVCLNLNTVHFVQILIMTRWPNIITDFYSGTWVTERSG